jgi:two-component system, NarL family, response regulator LiaR
MGQFITTPETKNKLIRVLIVDDVEQVRIDLRLLLQVSGEVDVVGEAGNGQEAISQARLLNPEVVIMDLEMPIMDGIDATAQIKQQKLAQRVVILSVHTDPVDISRAVQAGADSFVQKGSPYTTLMESLDPNKLNRGEIK